jgi:hypothetical protein
MKRIPALAALAFAAGCAAQDPGEMRADSEARLAAQLRDYEQSGPGQSCVSMREVHGNRSAGEGAILFTGTGGRIFVNRPPAGCPVLSSGRSLQIRTTTSQLCRGDIVTVADLTTGMEFGGCGLGEFTPYRRRGS